jgi:hypothetical protein
MLLTTARATITGTVTTFTITVPGQQLWRLRSVIATATRAAGGAPNRAYQLAVTNGATTLVVCPAADAGTEPGTITATWTDTNSASVASGSVGVTVGPLGLIVIPSGYKIVGTILSPAVGDTWNTATAWYEYSDT